MSGHEKKMPAVFNVRGVSDSSADVCMIEAYRDGKDGGELILFQPSFISHIAALGEDAARLTLHDGIKISVNMKPHDLWKKIFERDFRSAGDPVSLLSVTGTEGFPPPPIPENMRSGDWVEGQGVYLGKYEPKDRAGQTLGKVFNVFAAPQDLPGGPITYLETVKAVGELKNWHGYNGQKCAGDIDLYAIIRAGAYRGEWIIPTRDIVCGLDFNGNATMRDNLYDRKDEGLFKGTFTISGGDNNANCYWSSTFVNNRTDAVHGVNMYNKNSGNDKVNDEHFSCRLVRLVPV